MSFVEQGFLSYEMCLTRDSVRAKYTEYLAVLMRLNDECVAAQYELDISPHESRDILGAAFFVRTLASSQAAAILLEHGLVAQAESVLRTSLESLFALAALEAKPALAMQLAQSQEANKRSLADKMLQWSGEELRASRDTRIGEDELLILKSSKAREFTTHQLAEAAGMLDWYYSLYALMSHPAHAHVSDLTSHLVANPDGSIGAIQNEPQLDGQENTWVFIIEIQLRAAKAVVSMFGIASIGVQVHETALRKLVEGANS